MQSDRVILDIGSVGDFGCSRFYVAAQERDFLLFIISLFRFSTRRLLRHSTRRLLRHSTRRLLRHRYSID